eukprot:642441-Prymnesium_polylepis.1
MPRRSCGGVTGATGRARRFSSRSRRAAHVHAAATRTRGSCALAAPAPRTWDSNRGLVHLDLIGRLSHCSGGRCRAESRGGGAAARA